MRRLNLVLLAFLFLFVACAHVSMKWVNQDPNANLERDELACKRDWVMTSGDDSNAVWVDRAMREKAFNKCMQARGWKWVSSGNL